MRSFQVCDRRGCGGLDSDSDGGLDDLDGQGDDVGLDQFDRGLVLVVGVELGEAALKLGVDRGRGQLDEKVRRQFGQRRSVGRLTLGATLGRPRDQERLERNAPLNTDAHVLAEAEVRGVFLGRVKGVVDRTGAAARVETRILRGACEAVVLDECGCHA